MHDTGQGFQFLDTSMFPTTALVSVLGFASDDVWVSGEHAGTLRREHLDQRPVGDRRVRCPSDPLVVGPLGDRRHGVVHWDGTKLTVTTIPTTNGIAGLWGRARRCLALGDAVYAWDGTKWTAVYTPPVGVYLHGAWGSGASDVYVVGDSGTILHWDGTAWTVMASGTTSDLLTVWGTDAQHVWAGGENGTVLARPVSRACGTLLGERGPAGASVLRPARRGAVPKPSDDIQDLKRMLARLDRLDGRALACADGVFLFAPAANEHEVVRYAWLSACVKRR